MSVPSDRQFDLSNPELTEAVKAVAERDTPERRQVLYQALLDSTLILPTPEEPEESGTEPAASDITEEDEALTFVTFEDDAGETVLIVFTEEDAALAWEPEGLPYIALKGRDLLMIAAENEVAALVLNPGSPETAHLDQDEIVALSQGETPAPHREEAQVMPGGMTVLIGPPAEEPPENWQEAIREVLDRYPSIESAYFFQLHLPPEGIRHVIGLELYQGMSREAQDRLMETMVREFEELLPEGQTLDFIVLDEQDFRKTVKDTVEPIYTRPA